LNSNFETDFWVFYEIDPNTFIWENNMVAEQKLKGPASYFPSIEKKYGQPIDHWIKLVQKQKDMKHMEVVNWLKNEYGLGHGHGHANAIVAHYFAQMSA
jgi:hypothetical protein